MIGIQNSPSTTNGLPWITPLFSISHTTASSTSVPVPPLQATNPCPKRISSNKRSSQVATAHTSSTQAFAPVRKNLAVTASVRPPGSLAPREAASLTPPYPPPHPPKPPTPT